MLTNKRIMHLPFKKFQELFEEFEAFMQNWINRADSFKREIKDVKEMQKRQNANEPDIVKVKDKLNQKFIMLDALNSRVLVLRDIRKDFEDMRSCVDTAMATDQYVRSHALKAMQEAYTSFVQSDVLNTSNPKSFETSVATYKSKIDEVEIELETKIREYLEGAKNDANGRASTHVS